MSGQNYFPHANLMFVQTQSSLLQKTNPHFFKALNIEELTLDEQEALFGILDGEELPVFRCETVAWALTALTTEFNEFRRAHVQELSGFYGTIGCYLLDQKSEEAVQHRIHIYCMCRITCTPQTRLS